MNFGILQSKYATIETFFLEYLATWWVIDPEFQSNFEHLYDPWIPLTSAF